MTMSKITITKKDMIEAMKTEPLAPGVWVSMAGTKDCRVCAVGGILRAAGVDEGVISLRANDLTPFQQVSYDEDDYDGMEDEFGVDDLIEQHLENKNYMAAMSVEYESIAQEYGLERTRKLMITWIEGNIPDNIKIEVER